MGWFSSAGKERRKTKAKLDKLIHEERRKDERRKRIRDQPQGPRPAHKKPRGWWF
jgi:hypothetical protein